MVMTVIKVTRGGCGINYTDAHGNTRHTLKTPENGPFECDIDQAQRLIDLGVAELVSPWTIPEGDAAQSDEQQGDTDEQQEEQADGSQETEEATGRLDAEQLEGMDYNELKKLAADMGVEPEGKKKSDYIAAIVAAEVKPGDEDDDELPELNAADPE